MRAREKKEREREGWKGRGRVEGEPACPTHLTNHLP